MRESIISVSPIFAEKPYFMSDEFTIVDCCVLPILWRLPEIGIRLPETNVPRSAWRAYLTPNGGLIGGPHAFLYIVGSESVTATVHLDLPASLML